MNFIERLTDDATNSVKSGELQLTVDEADCLADFRSTVSGCTDEEARNRLGAFLAQHRQLASQLGKFFVAQSYSFLNEELSRFREIKQQRPLSIEEIRYVSTTLVDLVNSTVSLIKQAE